MSRTLFWYVLRDLLRIFFMASGALAGIMSFGGLLKPLTEHGLSAGQVGRMLGYFTPAMTAYSFPVAALFATVMVYGRLSADNELTACRSSGISYWAMTMPAWVLGLVVAIVSLVFLCFVVPAYTLKVEKVVYSNLAQLVQNKIEATHQIKFDTINVFAQEARVLPRSPDRPRDQHVQLVGPMIVSYANEVDPAARYRVPSTFWMASLADVYLRQRGEVVEFEARLSNGTSFARELKNKSQIGTSETQFGPFKFASPIREDTKFMDIVQLKYLYNNPEESRRLQDEVHALIRQAMLQQFLEEIADSLNSSTNSWSAETSDGRRITLVRGDEPVRYDAGQTELRVRSRTPARPDPRAAPGPGQVRLIEGSRAEKQVSAVEMKITADPQFPDRRAEAQAARAAEKGGAKPGRPTSDNAGENPDEADDFDTPRIVVVIEGFDARIETTEEEAAHRTLPRKEFVLPMPRDLGTLRSLLVGDLLGDIDPRRMEKVNRTPWAGREGMSATEQVLKAANEAGERQAGQTARQFAALLPPNAAQLPLAERIKLLVQCEKLMGERDKQRKEEKVKGEDARDDVAKQQLKAARLKVRREKEALLQDHLKLARGSRLATNEVTRLGIDRGRLVAKISAEIHGRAAFAVSCLVLVVVGCALGMMFKSGNLLSAFSVSFIPAMLSIALIVTGQQICGNTSGSLSTGLAFLWSGNIAVAALAAVLLTKLQRT